MFSKTSRRRIGYTAIASLILKLALVALALPLNPAAATAANAPFEVVICTAHGLMTVPLDDLFPADDDGTKDSNGAPPFCPFCQTLSSAAWAIEPGVARCIPSYVLVKHIVGVPDVIPRALHRPPPAARGPPAFQT